MQEVACPNMLIGSYTQGQEKPGLFFLNSAQHTATSLQHCTNPSYALSLNGHIYAVEEHEKGLVLTFDAEHKIISRVSTLGKDPCHISADRSGKFLVVLNYGSGSIFICQLDEHKPTKVHTFITLEGSGDHPTRQASPHPHSSVFSHDNTVLFVADLGTDIVFWYDFTNVEAIFDKNKSIKMPGTGPRTLAMGPASNKLIYLTCELDNTVRVLSYEKNMLELLSAFRLTNNPQNCLSEVVYFNSALYVALRGEDKIMVFDQEKEDKSKLAQRLSFKVGQSPRHFAIHPSGYLVVACQKENKVMKFLMKEDKIYHISELEVKSPSVVVFLQ